MNEVIREVLIKKIIFKKRQSGRAKQSGIWKEDARQKKQQCEAPRQQHIQSV